MLWDYTAFVLLPLGLPHRLTCRTRSCSLSSSSSFQRGKPNCSSWTQGHHSLSDGVEVNDLFRTSHRPATRNNNIGQIFIKPVKEFSAKMLCSELLLLNIYRGKTLVLAFTFFLKHFFTAHDRHGRTTYGLELFVLQVVSGLLDKLSINCGEKMLQERALRNNTATENNQWSASFFF